MRALLLVGLVVVLLVLTLLAVRRALNPARPVTSERAEQPTSHSAVRVLTNPEELTAALERAAEGERRTAGLISARLARYESRFGNPTPPD